MKFSQSEIDAIDAFEKEHMNCYKKPGALSKVLGFTIHSSWGSCIGVNTYITCDCCGKTKDVSDYDMW